MNHPGNPVSPGIAMGPALCYAPFVPAVEKKRLAPEQAAAALERYDLAKARAREELEQLQKRLGKTDPQRGDIFAAHLDILFDVVMEEEIRQSVTDAGLSPDWAASQVYDRYARVIAQVRDPLIRERGADLVDVKNRLLRCWQGLPEQNLAALEEPVVLVARELLPSDAAALDREKVLAIVTQGGGSTSHAAILARGYGIPALMGVRGLDAVGTGDLLLVDAVAGVLVTCPTREEQECYAQKSARFLCRTRENARYLYAPGRTGDGVAVEVHLNIGSAGAQELAGEAFADGVGLFRTEFLYMGRADLPSEEEQAGAYRRVLEAFGGKPVTIRTLDVGGDKSLASLDLPREENPFLGNRALRLCFEHPELFLTQLRALLRASVWGNLQLMFPMVSGLEDLRRAKELLARAKAQLDARGVAYDPNLRVGVMVEVPSMALLADLAAQEADFASIGTNDLTQYLTAADRMNPAVARYYQAYHPAVFRLVGYVAQQFARVGKPVGVCGELGGDPLAAPVLVGLGVGQLSMGPASVAPVKQGLAALTLPKAQALAREVLSCSTAQEVERCLRQGIE